MEIGCLFWIRDNLTLNLKLLVSPVDAIGAMQVLPSTARALGRLHGRSFDLLKASDNVEAGVLLLRDAPRYQAMVAAAETRLAAARAVEQQS